MARRNSRRNDGQVSEFKKKRRMRLAGLVALCIVSATVLSAGIGFMSDGFTNSDVSSWMDRELNADNLIKVDDYLIKDGDTNGEGITVSVNEDGVIKLNGKSTGTDEYTVCELSVAPGTYTISGVASTGDCGLQVLGSGIEAKAGTRNDSFTVEETTTISVVVYVGEDVKLFNKTIKPVLVKGEEPGDFYA